MSKTPNTARICFYSREGYLLQDIPFNDPMDADEWFDTLHSPGDADLYPGWYAATLEHFANTVPVIKGTIYNGFAS